ncbi:hypothetical protein LTS10_010735 [Elasticomyces elasticus]|nr:hypothetical protein LTS10_010735 [Elasticomyces elasticus]
MASKSPLDVDGEEWETISPGVRRKIKSSDKRIRIEYVTQEPVKTHQELLRDRINALPDREYASYILTLRGSRGMHRAEALGSARKHIRQCPNYAGYDSPLEWAISRDTIDLLEKLINGRDFNDQIYKDGAPFDPNTVSSSQTALYHALQGNKRHNVLLLLDSGADPNVYSVYTNENDDDPWQAPLHRAATDWHPDLITILLERGAAIDAPSLLNGQTPLHHALLAARFWATTRTRDWAALRMTVECLTAAGADVNVRDDDMNTPLDIWLSIASNQDNPEMQRITTVILEAGADINSIGADGYSPFLLAAALDGPSKLFRLILGAYKPDLDLQNTEGDTALHLLAERGATEDLKLLMDAGADPNIRGAHGETPLFRAACRRGFHEIVKTLLTRADPTICRDDGRNAIDLTVMSGGIAETMEVFRDHGSSLATIVLRWEILKACATQTGTAEVRLNELVLGPEAGAASKGTTDGSLYHGVSKLVINEPATDHGVISAEIMQSETEAFTRSATAYEALSDPTLPDSTGTIVPKRLLDVNTGKLVPGEHSMGYVIGSYLWSPEKTPGLHTHLDAYEPVPETAQRVLEACKKHPELIEMVPPEHEGCSTLKFPHKRLYPREPNAAYLSDVYRLLGREAKRRGLHHVWIDSFCIDQNDKQDKAEQIPLMADYYRNAECCVVVSESLRRHIRPECDPSRSLFDSHDSITDRILGWAIGFHYNRVWVLQETRLAKEVITRSGNVRIKTTEVLSPNFDKDSVHANSLWQGTFDWGPVNHARDAINKANQKLPLSGSRIDRGPPISPDFCMMLLRDRNSLYQHDRIFGALGLFPSSVRQAVPIDYSLSLSAVFAIFVYLRVRSGDVISLLTMRAPDRPPHSIQNCPSWLPSGYGFNYADILDLETDPALDFRAATDGKLFLTLMFMRIADCYSFASERSSATGIAKYGNMILTLMDRDRALLPEQYSAAVEPSDPDYSLTSQKSFGTGNFSVKGPALEPSQISASDASKVADERERRRLQVQIAARQNRAVIVMLGVENRTSVAGLVNSIWLILCTDDEGRTWQKHGVAVITREKAKCSIGSSGTESQRFCIV